MGDVICAGAYSISVSGLASDVNLFLFDSSPQFGLNVCPFCLTASAAAAESDTPTSSAVWVSMQYRMILTAAAAAFGQASVSVPLVPPPSQFDASAPIASSQRIALPPIWVVANRTQTITGHVYNGTAADQHSLAIANAFGLGVATSTISSNGRLQPLSSIYVTYEIAGRVCSAGGSGGSGGGGAAVTDSNGFYSLQIPIAGDPVSSLAVIRFNDTRWSDVSVSRSVMNPSQVLIVLGGGDSTRNNLTSPADRASYIHQFSGSVVVVPDTYLYLSPSVAEYSAWSANRVSTPEACGFGTAFSSYANAANGGCDPLTHCEVPVISSLSGIDPVATVIGQCTACPAGYNGTGATGCQVRCALGPFCRCRSSVVLCCTSISIRFVSFSRLCCCAVVLLCCCAVVLLCCCVTCRFCSSHLRTSTNVLSVKVAD